MHCVKKLTIPLLRVTSFMNVPSGQPQLAFEQLGTAMAFDPNCTRAVMAAGSMMQSHHDYDVALVSSTNQIFEKFCYYFQNFLTY